MIFKREGVSRWEGLLQALFSRRILWDWGKGTVGGGEKVRGGLRELGGAKKTSWGVTAPTDAKANLIRRTDE